jgi:hypothetical protein
MPVRPSSVRPASRLSKWNNPASTSHWELLESVSKKIQVWWKIWQELWVPYMNMDVYLWQYLAVLASLWKHSSVMKIWQELWVPYTNMDVYVWQYLVVLASLWKNSSVMKIWQELWVPYINMDVYLWQYLAVLASLWKHFQTKFLERIKTQS